jgi:hypothetical protein
MIARTPFLILLSLASIFPGPLSADVVTYAFTGTVDTVSSLDPFNPFPQQPDFGTPFSGTYTFDSAAPNQIIGDPKTGTYASSGGSFGMTFSLGGLNLAYSGVVISVEDNYFPTTDAYFASHFETSVDSVKPTGVELSMALTDYTGAVFSDNSLPLLPPPLAAFQSETLFFTDTLTDSFGNADQVELTGKIDSLTELPEPRRSGYLLPVLLSFAIIGLKKYRTQ